ncbi:hypothetical protein [Alcanivorax profundi]|uniref:hypothetical protein n=1 Tax=Alcanivorax profundi TaxID=2338368 RepID=UPI0032B20338
MRRNSFTTNLLLAATLTLGAAQAQALTELSDDSLSEVQGMGLAFALDNFSIRFAPTSFIELTGTEAQGAGWERGDARYYGLSLTNGEAVAGTDWYGNGCSTTGIAGALGCPLGNANPSNSALTANAFGVGALASPYDPYVLRVFQYNGHDYQGNFLSGASRPTVMELIGPSNTETWRWGFWGELEVDRQVGQPSADIGAANCLDGAASGCARFLQSQTIIRGKPTTVDGKPAILRLMQTADSADPTLGITYQSALSGDFRFSVRQKNNSPDALHIVPDFDDNEGMYFKNVDAFLPLGTLHYQAITLNAVRDGSNEATGDFVIELTRIPNDRDIYNHFYCGQTGVQAPGSCALDADGKIASPNEDTRGYVRWGDFDGVNIATGAGLPSATATDNGIFFVNPSETPANQVTNIGISRIEGMRIHHLKITTLGAGVP